MALSVLYACCVGLDVHKATVVACLLLDSPLGQSEQRCAVSGWSYFPFFFASCSLFFLASAAFSGGSADAMIRT